MSSSTTGLAYVVTRPFSTYAVGQLIPVANLTATQVTTYRDDLTSPIQISGSAGAAPIGSTPTTSTSTGTTTTSTTGGIALTAAQTAALAGYPALNAAEVADASAIGTHTVQIGVLNAQVAALQSQASTTGSLDASQTVTLSAFATRLSNDDAEIASLVAQLAAQSGGSGSGVAATAYIAVIF